MPQQTLTAAFTGHRTYDHSADDQLCDTVESLYNDGYRHFRIGMAEGFDLAAGEAVLRLMDNHDDICLELCIPYPNFNRGFGIEENNRFNRIISKASVIRYAADSYHKSVFSLRNNMLVDRADTVVAWYSLKRGGTHYTINRARRYGVRIINLYPDPQFNISF